MHERELECIKNDIESVLKYIMRRCFEMYMEEKYFISFLFRTLLLEEFRSKRAMARKLGMSLRTLQENFQHLDCAKGGTVAFERLVFYCVEHNISLQNLYDRYLMNKKN